MAATGPLVKTWMESVFANENEPLRYAGVAMCSCFLVRIATLWFAPETKGKPLPE